MKGFKMYLRIFLYYNECVMAVSRSATITLICRWIFVSHSKTNLGFVDSRVSFHLLIVRTCCVYISLDFKCWLKCKNHKFGQVSFTQMKNA